MITIILAGLALILYLLGAVVYKEHVENFMVREGVEWYDPFTHYAFIAAWPLLVARALFDKEEND